MFSCRISFIQISPLMTDLLRSPQALFHVRQLAYWVIVLFHLLICRIGANNMWYLVFMSPHVVCMSLIHVHACTCTCTMWYLVCLSPHVVCMSLIHAHACTCTCTPPCRPFWLSPRQVCVVPVSQKFDGYANKVRGEYGNVYASLCRYCVY